MKKLKLIYNPFSGDKSFRYDLDPCLKAFQEGGYDTHVFRSMRPGDIEEHIAHFAGKTNYDVIVACGGDGTVNAVLNAMKTNGIDCPLGIIPAGTANDFAHFLKIPTDPYEASLLIAKGTPKAIDIGRVNDRYFINVCAAGMLANISQNIDISFKNTFGKLAYYLKGMEQLPNFTPISIQITNSKETFTESVYFFFALNSAGTGGFEKLSPLAQIDDGLFDFVAFRDFPIHELPLLFLKVLKGEYLDDNRIVFFKDSYIKIEQSNPEVAQLFTDIDGEMGPAFPIEIRNLHNEFKMFVG